MRAASLLVVVGALAGCGNSSPCDGVAGACIGAHVKGNATGLEQLVISIDQPTAETVRSPSVPAPIRLPARVALALPVGAGGAITVHIDGVDGSGAVIASDEHVVSLPASGRTDVDFVLNHGSSGGGGDGGVDGGDGGVGPDMATGIVIAGAVDTTGYELDPVSINFSATDPQSTDLMLTASGVPSTASFTASGATGMLTWTPSLSEGGVGYPITMTATSASNPSRVGMTPFTLTIKNTIDPVINPFGISPDQLVLDPVGDVDGDGFADFAFCTTTGAANALPQYSIQIIYGDKSGLPTARPYPTSTRTRAITFSGPVGSTDQFSGTVSCAGGDFDGDGKSDVVIADSAYVPSGSTTAVGTYFLVFGTPRADTAAPVTVQLAPVSPSDGLGGPLTVGDWNGDGLADFAAMQTNVPSPAAGVSATAYIWSGVFPRPTTLATGRPIMISHPCGNPPVVLGYAAPDGSLGTGGKKQHALVIYDQAIAANGTFPGSCATADGGLHLVSFGSQITPITNVALHAESTSFRSPFAFCDVDGDGKDDLVAATFNSTNSTWSVAVVVGTASGWPTPLDLSKAAALNVTVGGYPGLACWKSAYGPTRFAVGDPGGLSSQGYLRAGQVFLYDVVNGVPTLTKTLPNFDSNASYRGFGANLRLPGDVDGDGNPELEITYASGSPGPFYAWMLYGR